MKKKKMRKGQKSFLIIFNVFLCLVLISGCTLNLVNYKNSKTGSADNSITTTTSAATGTTKTGKTSARMMCAGDNLIHQAIYTQAKARAGGSGYDFSYPYEKIEKIIALSDIAFINQETIMDKDKEPSTYPLFNSPTQLGDHMIDIGFDVFNQATNHCMDKGLSGALNDINYFKSKKNVILTGLYEKWDDITKPETMTENNITFSFVGFSEYLNGLVVPSDSDLGLVYLTDKRHTQEELYSTMKTAIQNAKKVSDVVCVSMHWQTEGITAPNDAEKKIVSKLIEFGADVIIGTGPHVLQPIEMKKNAQGKNVLVIWSLGNFISTQSNKNELLGGIADVKFSKDYATDTTTVTSAKLIPTITQYGSGRSSVHIEPLSGYSASLASAHSVSITYDYIKNYYKDMFADRLETEVDGLRS